jgi:hypothetical protein
MRAGSTAARCGRPTSATARSANSRRRRNRRKARLPVSSRLLTAGHRTVRHLLAGAGRRTHHAGSCRRDETIGMPCRLTATAVMGACLPCAGCHDQSGVIGASASPSPAPTTPPAGGAARDTDHLPGPAAADPVLERGFRDRPGDRAARADHGWRRDGGCEQQRAPAPDGGRGHGRVLTCAWEAGSPAGHGPGADRKAA